MFDFYKQQREKAEELAIHKTGTILYRVAPIFYGTTLQGKLEKYIVSNIPCQVVCVSIEDGMVEHYIRSCDAMNFDNEAFTDTLIGSATAGEHNNHGNYYYFTEQIQAEAYCNELNAKLNKDCAV